MSPNAQHPMRLIEQYCNGTISDEDLRTLERHLLDSAELRAMLRRYLALDAALRHDSESIDQIVSSFEPRAPAPATTVPEHRSHRLTTAVIGTLAAAVAVLVGFLFIEPDVDREVIQIVEFNGAIQWTGDGGRVELDFTKGQHFGGGTLESLSADSWIEFQFKDGSTITISGPSGVTVSEGEQKQLHLRHGTLSATVEKQPAGKPLLIHTPTAELAVLGTQFNVDAKPSITAVTVNEGKVRVTRLADGTAADVPADHRVVASASRQDVLTVAPRERSIGAWRSDLPNGVVYGELSAENDQLHATALLWRGCEQNQHEPILLYVAALGVSRGPNPPVALESGTKFRVRGRMDTPRDLVIGLTTQHLKGGFAGKHLAHRSSKTIPKDGGDFDLTISIEEFRPEKPNYPQSPIGLGLYDWWALTVNEDAGLIISSVELLKSDTRSDDR